MKEPFVPATGDDFEKESLGLQWQWNHLPVAEKWSLKERPGWMRLHSVGVVENIHQARNTLTQRVVGPACSAEVTLDFSNLATGDVAGLSIFQDQHGYVGITKEEGFYLVMVKDHEVEERIPLDSSEPVRLKAVFDGIADIGTFAYEKNGEWVSIGCEVPLRFKLSHFVGNRFALFNFATNQEGGWADFDEFDFTPLPSGVYPVDLRNRTEAEHFIAQSGVQIESCDDEDGGYMIGDWDHHDWILLEPWIAGDDLRLELRVKNRFRRVKLRLRSGGVDGEMLAVADVPATEEEWQTVTIEEPLNLSEGQKLCIQFRGLSPGFKLNYLKWKKEE